MFSIVLYSAEEVNYKVRYKKKNWSSDLANPESQLYEQLEDEIQQTVNIGVVPVIA